MSVPRGTSGGARAWHAWAAARAKLLNSLVVLPPNEDEMKIFYGKVEWQLDIAQALTNGWLCHCSEDLLNCLWCSSTR
jgi:hypothetical protein